MDTKDIPWEDLEIKAHLGGTPVTLRLQAHVDRSVLPGPVLYIRLSDEMRIKLATDYFKVEPR